MESEPRREVVVTAERRPLAAVSTADLVRQLIQECSELAKKEIQLARCELRADLISEIKMAKGLGVAGICAFAALNTLLAAAILALAQALAAWLSALIVAAVVLSIGTVVGLIAWAKRVKRPLEKTQKTLKDDLQWAKEQIP